MIHLLLLTLDQNLINQFQHSVTEIMNDYCQIQYKITIVKNQNADIVLKKFAIDEFNVLFFDENIDEIILQYIRVSRPDIYFVIYSHKKEIPFYYDYHIFSSLPYVNNQTKYIKTFKSLVAIYSDKPKKKVHFISNKMLLLFEYDQIIQLHYKDHKLFLTTHDGQYQVKGSLKNYIYLVEKYNFIMTSRSKIINPKYKNTRFVNDKLYLK